MTMKPVPLVAAIHRLLTPLSPLLAFVSRRRLFGADVDLADFAGMQFLLPGIG